MPGHPMGPQLSHEGTGYCRRVSRTEQMRGAEKGSFVGKTHRGQARGKWVCKVHGFLGLSACSSCGVGEIWSQIRQRGLERIALRTDSNELGHLSQRGVFLSLVFRGHTWQCLVVTPSSVLGESVLVVLRGSCGTLGSLLRKLCSVC